MNPTGRLPGTTVRNRILFASTGTAALDALLGGGAPNTALIVVDEVGDSQQYFPPLAHCFLAEGMNEEQTVVCATAFEITATQFLKRLPQRIINTAADEEGRLANAKNVADLNFRIAWRYVTTPKIDSSIRSPAVTNKFDISQSVADKDLEAWRQTGRLYILAPPSVDDLPTFKALWAQLHELLADPDYGHDAPPPRRKFLRILLPDLTSAVWTDSQRLSTFLARLKAFCRRLNCLVMIGINSSTLTTAVTQDVLRLSDAFIRLEFIDEEHRRTMTTHQTFDGRLYVLKLPAIYAAAPHSPDCLDLIFSLKRTHFDVKIFHLPPAVGGGDEKAKALAGRPTCQQLQDEF